MKTKIKSQIIIVVCCLLFLVSSISYGQDNSTQAYDISGITVFVAPLKNSEELSIVQSDKLQNKMITALYKENVGITNVYQEFDVTASFQIEDEEIVEGLRNQTIITAELVLQIEQKTSEKVVSIYTQTIKGAGWNKKKAINDAIQNLSFKGEKFSSFLKIAKQKIVGYYKNNCNMIIVDAQNAFDQSDYKKVLNIVTSIPKEAKQCYNRGIAIGKTSNDEADNWNALVTGKLAINRNDLNTAIEHLNTVDTSSIYSGEAQDLIASAKTN
jgi:hypothetical protein